MKSKSRTFSVGHLQTPIRTLRGIQQPLTGATYPSIAVAVEPKGVVYTKRWVADLILDLAGYVPSARLADLIAVEPAAGEGAFLQPMIERLIASCTHFGRNMAACSTSICAFELSDISADRARQLAKKCLIENGVEKSLASQLAHSWIHVGDYLLESLTLEADFVIGNPPYVRLEEIPEQVASLYRHLYPTMRGRADLYVAFYEAGLRQLKPDGTCAFICADRWMRNQYGGELRKLITDSFSVDAVIEMHDAPAFDEDVDAYPAITVISNKMHAGTVVASLGLEAEGIPADTLTNSLGQHSTISMPGLRAARVDKWFTDSDPWPCSSPEQLALLRRLEDRFPELETNARIGIGVATGRDSVFITKDSSLVEPSRLLKLAMAKDITGGKISWSGHYLVNPWNGKGLVALEDFPRMQSYFEQHSTVLKDRHTAIKSASAWYKTIDRVSDSLTNQPKLYIADIKNRLDPVLDEGNTYPHHNLYFIASEGWDLQVLGGILISAIGQFFVESYGVRMRGGYLRFQAQYLRRIRVPDPSSISNSDAEELRLAFRERDRALATEVSLRLYGVDQEEMEIALGHR